MAPKSARVSSATGRVILAVPKISEWYTPGATQTLPSHSLEFQFQFDSETEADKLPVEYRVTLNDPSQILKPKDEHHVDYAHITETGLHLVMRDISAGLRKNGRRVVIRGNISVGVYD
ncbi:MAG: hypothetical protein AABX03_03495 [Nanoarchaeota archaeon]